MSENTKALERAMVWFEGEAKTPQHHAAVILTQLAEAKEQLAEYEAFIHSAWCYGAFDGHPNLGPKANAVVAKRMGEMKAQLDATRAQPNKESEG